MKAETTVSKKEMEKERESVGVEEGEKNQKEEQKEVQETLLGHQRRNREFQEEIQRGV